MIFCNQNMLILFGILQYLSIFCRRNLFGNKKYLLLRKGVSQNIQINTFID